MVTIMTNGKFDIFVQRYLPFALCLSSRCHLRHPRHDQNDEVRVAAVKLLSFSWLQDYRRIIIDLSTYIFLANNIELD